ncbi:GNAT family N-acetyltransferase [Microbacterium sp. Sa4CUA7]|uniref:GNAT family N-acetyltransferase n=1 Tax=Microbacterium pullorum TaxID=2762236 RepID=A0ABR8S4B8_9MICO|nr:GNAT family N-acetyltransferase [Microbacterium pullorum]MBD7958330.1 GNAT family N-acetyltransferase [Microbacterium pullorum]
MPVTLQRWSEDDLGLLVRMNTPAMTAFLGGPESTAAVLDRHERYLRPADASPSRMYRIDVDGEPAGAIGYWEGELEGTPVFETGWSVVPERQGRGVARAALDRLIARVREDGRRDRLIALPGADNVASNALCRGAGFREHGQQTELFRGSELTFRIWVLDL